MTDALAIHEERPDHPEVAALLRSLDDYLHTLYPPQAIYILDLDALRQPGVTFLAARAGDRVVGCGAVRRMPAEVASGGRAYGEIKRMMVAPEVRGRRIGERLLDALESALRGEGIELALLETGEPQVAAVRLYERCGYRRRGPFGAYPDIPESLFMEKALVA